MAEDVNFAGNGNRFPGHSFVQNMDDKTSYSGGPGFKCRPGDRLF